MCWSCLVEPRACLRKQEVPSASAAAQTSETLCCGGSLGQCACRQPRKSQAFQKLPQDVQSWPYPHFSAPPTISSSLPGPEVAVDLAEDKRMEKREQVAKEGQFHGAHIDAFPVALPWQQLRASSTDCWVPSIAWPGMSCWGPPDLNEGSSWAMLTAPQEEALKAQTLCLGLNLQQSVLGTGAAGSRGPDPRVPDSTPACSLVSCTGTVGGGACKVAASELPGSCGAAPVVHLLVLRSGSKGCLPVGHCDVLLRPGASITAWWSWGAEGLWHPLPRGGLAQVWPTSGARGHTGPPGWRLPSEGGSSKLMATLGPHSASCHRSQSASRKDLETRKTTSVNTKCQHVFHSVSLPLLVSPSAHYSPGGLGLARSAILVSQRRARKPSA